MKKRKLAQAIILSGTVALASPLVLAAAADSIALNQVSNATAVEQPLLVATCSASNPCAASACNPCNPCAASACNPCNPCAASA